MKIKSRIIPAKPRSKELLNRHRYGSSSFTGSGTGEGKSEVIPIPTYWELIEVDEEGNPLAEPYIITKYPAVSEKELSAHGVGGNLGTGGTSYTRLDNWFEYDVSKEGWVLSAKLGKDLLDKHNDLEEKVDELESSETSGDKNYITEVNMPSKRWHIIHNLEKYPSVTVINNDNQVVVGDVEYLDINSLIIYFSAEFSGKVICN